MIYELVTAVSGQVLGSHLQSQATETEEIPFASDASLENLTNYCYVLDDEMQKMRKKSKETEIQVCMKFEQINNNFISH